MMRDNTIIHTRCGKPVRVIFHECGFWQRGTGRGHAVSVTANCVIPIADGAVPKTCPQCGKESPSWMHLAPQICEITPHAYSWRGNIMLQSLDDVLKRLDEFFEAKLNAEK